MHIPEDVNYDLRKRVSQILNFIPSRNKFSFAIFSRIILLKGWHFLGVLMSPR